MRRIHGMDFLKGIAILFMMFFHNFVVYEGDLNQVANNTTSNPVASGIKFLARWAGLFFIISGAVHTYSYYNRRKTDSAQSKNLVKESIVIGVVLILMEKIISIIFNRSSRGGGLFPFDIGPTNYSILGSIIEIGEFKLPTFFNVVYFMGALHILGLSLIIYGCIVAILFHNDGYSKLNRNMIILSGFGILFIILSLFFSVSLHEKWLSYIEQGMIFRAILIGTFVADSHPLFPCLAYSFFGCVLGLGYVKENWNIKVFIIGTAFGITSTITGSILYFLNGEPPVDFILRTVSYSPQMMFLQLGLMTLLFMIIYYVEMQEVHIAKKHLLRNPFITRFSFTSLTIYKFEGFIAIIVKYLILDQIFPGWASSMGWVVIYSLGLIIIWNIILKYWEKKGFVGSLEWCLIRIKSKC